MGSKAWICFFLVILYSFLQWSVTIKLTTIWESIFFGFTWIPSTEGTNKSKKERIIHLNSKCPPLFLRVFPRKMFGCFWAFQFFGSEIIHFLRDQRWDPDQWWKGQRGVGVFGSSKCSRSTTAFEGSGFILAGQIETRISRPDFFQAKNVVGKSQAKKLQNTVLGVGVGQRI